MYHKIVRCKIWENMDSEYKRRKIYFTRVYSICILQLKTKPENTNFYCQALERNTNMHVLSNAKENYSPLEMVISILYFIKILKNKKVPVINKLYASCLEIFPWNHLKRRTN